MGKRRKLSSNSWTRLWYAYASWHTGFSGNFWAEDMELCLGAQRAELSKGSLDEWATQIGEKAAWLYSFITPEYEMSRRQLNELEDLNYEMMARAGYRLAVLLNSVVM
jgi:hypothetical protein